MEATRGMLEIRRQAERAQQAYEAIYVRQGIRSSRRRDAWLLRLAEARPGMSLLDVACGEADLVLLAAHWGLEAHGVDFSLAALRRVPRGTPVAGLAVADGQALPYGDATFDRVMCIGSLEHFVDPQRGAAELARVLKPDGLAVVLLPNSFGLRWSVLYAWRHGDIHDDGQPLQRYGTRLQWARLLASGGLEVERVVGYEGTLVGLRDWLGILRHPSRLLIPLGGRLPVDMASMFVFLCRKVAEG